jgi:BA14K-like protein
MINYPRIAKFVAAALVVAGTLGAATGAQAIQNSQSFQNNGVGTNWNHHNHYNQNYGYNNYGPGYGYGYGYDGGGALVAGLLGGLVAGTVANSYNQPYPDGNSCYRFRTYNPTTGMYMSYNGPRHCP